MEGETCGLLSPGSCGLRREPCEGAQERRASGHWDAAASGNSPRLSASLRSDKFELQGRAWRDPHAPVTSPPGCRSQWTGDTGSGRTLFLLCLALPSCMKEV